jgi:dTDP-4-amino-4,6-dideoxygalactose transaminase
MTYRIPFNKPFIAGKELYYVAEAVTRGNIAADGYFTNACCRFLEQQFGIKKVLLVPSGTAALELAAMLCDLKPGDEVIMPSYTFVSTASAFVRVGARPVFVDIRPDTLNIDEKLIEAAITERTRVIVPVHYAGVGCEMDTIMDIARRHNLLVVEDAAQGVNAFYKGRALGSIGHLGCYSFHETKNFICGEGGALCINDERFIERAEILRDKGTNRQKFFRGEVDKYTWVDIGSSYVMAELLAAFLYGQLEQIEAISRRRREIFERYHELLAPLEEEGFLRRPTIPPECQSNYHIYYILLQDEATRDGLMAYLKAQGILAVFHYVPLHTSPMGRSFGYKEGQLPVTEDLASRMLRLPVFYSLANEQQTEIVDRIRGYFAPWKRNVAHVGATVPGLEYLSWDSDHFGFPIGRVSRHTSDSELLEVLNRARKAGYKLIYYRSVQEKLVADEILRQFGGILVDNAVTFEKQLGSGQWAVLDQRIAGQYLEVLNADSFQDHSVLDELAIVAGQYSRFFQDARIPVEKARELYRIWARRALRRELADEVYVALRNGDRSCPVGFVAVRVEQDAARVSLISVAPMYQRQGLGRLLMSYAESYARERKVARVIVTTQFRNQPACRLYEKIAYTPVRVENVYHFWLDCSKTYEK